jgi:hypothetical protein
LERVAGLPRRRFSFYLDLYNRAQYLPYRVETARPTPNDLAGRTRFRCRGGPGGALQSSDPESGLETDVRQMLGQLPEKYRQVITLFYLEQKSYEEVAALLGVPLGTVKTFLYRAKKELLKINSPRASAPAPLYEPAR